MKCFYGGIGGIYERDDRNAGRIAGLPGATQSRPAPARQCERRPTPRIRLQRYSMGGKGGRSSELRYPHSMAGTAEGAARARAIRDSRRAAAANIQQPGLPVDQPDGTVDVLMAVDVCERSLTNQVVARINAAANDALGIVHRVILGAIKAPIAVRVTAALKMIELSQQSAQQSAADDSQAAVIAKLAAALGRPMPRQPVTIEAERTDPVDKP